MYKFIFLSLSDTLARVTIGDTRFRVFETFKTHFAVELVIFTKIRARKKIFRKYVARDG